MQLTDLNLDFHPNSLTRSGNVAFGLARNNGSNRLAVLSGTVLDDFEGERSVHGSETLIMCPLTPGNAASLRKHLSWLKPRPLGLHTSAGLGDRLGLATPGHVRSLRALDGGIAPIFIQQSTREMTRTGRSPQQVMDDATWGIFAEGWQAPHGADADHLKSPADMDACLACGYTFFTIDPGAHVDDRAGTAGASELRQLVDLLPEEVLPKNSGLFGRRFDIEGLRIEFDEITLLRAAAKYGNAITFVASMYRHLQESAGAHLFELEVSIDETEQPTSHAEHVYIASELQRLGVTWVSLAPRFMGRFEKGVDYIGDLDAFEMDFAGHAAIARQFGPYKLSLHSGSDKFSIYPIAARLSQGLVHLKTAGTSYLEALHTIASVDPDFLKEIYAFARERYQTDRASYHVSAEIDCAPLPGVVTNWVDLLNQFDAREILHVTFGSVLTEETPSGGWRFRDRLMDCLQSNLELYATNLEKHFLRHLLPFMDR